MRSLHGLLLPVLVTAGCAAAPSAPRDDLAASAPAPSAAPPERPSATGVASTAASSVDAPPTRPAASASSGASTAPSAVPITLPESDGGCIPVMALVMCRTMSTEPCAEELAFLAATTPSAPSCVQRCARKDGACVTKCFPKCSTF